MSGVGLQFQFVDMAALQLRIDRMANLDTRGLMDAIGTEVVSQTVHRIREEKTSPQGEAWAAWSDRYAKTRTAGQSLLESEGHLIQSMTHLVELAGKEVDIGSNLIYARIQNDGGAKVGKPGLPAREYLGLSNANRMDIVKVCSAWLDGHLMGGVLQ